MAKKRESSRRYIRNTIEDGMTFHQCFEMSEYRFNTLLARTHSTSRFVIRYACTTNCLVRQTNKRVVDENTKRLGSVTEGECRRIGFGLKTDECRQRDPSSTNGWFP